MEYFKCFYITISYLTTLFLVTMLSKIRMILHDLNQGNSVRILFLKLWQRIIHLIIKRPGIPNRPVGHMVSLLEDLKSRGFQCSSILDVRANRGL